jgi:hypothetical protein
MGRIRITVSPFFAAKYNPSEACNALGGPNLAMAEGATPIDKTSHFGHIEYLNDGAKTSEDS